MDDDLPPFETIVLFRLLSFPTRPYGRIGKLQDVQAGSKVMGNILNTLASKDYLFIVGDYYCMLEGCIEAPGNSPKWVMDKIEEEFDALPEEVRTQMVRRLAKYAEAKVAEATEGMPDGEEKEDLIERIIKIAKKRV